MVDPNRLEILIYPDPVLRTKAEPITEIDDTVRSVAERMRQLMHEASGVGLAAPQVGLAWQLVVVSALDEERAEDRVLINPVVRASTRETEAREEGCLSLPGVNGPVRRPYGVALEATDLEGASISEEGEDLAARVWQHEIDHLDGVLIIDRMGPMDRRANRRAIRELEKSSVG